MKDLAVLDAMRGVLWEQKYRGTLDEVPEEQRKQLEIQARKNIGQRRPTPWSGKKTIPLSFPKRIGWGTYGWKYDVALVEAALENGAGMIDTAEGYGFGRVETELGKALRKAGPYSTLIASKVARNHLSKDATVSAGRRSRDKLGVESLDLYQIHWPVLNSLESTMDGMALLREEKVIKHVGVSNFCGYQLEAAVRAARVRDFEIATNQIRFNRMDPGAADYLFGRCEQLGVQVIVYSPFSQGKNSKNTKKDLGWILSHPIACVIPATNNLDHLRSNLAYT